MKYGLKRVKNRHYDSLSQIPWDRLESMLAVYYAAHGYRVEHVGTGKSGKKFDGGLDLKLRNDAEYIVVQVKHWNACKVPHNDVHQLLGVKVNEGATAAVLITSGEFTQAAKEAANRAGHVKLIDGVELREMIGSAMEIQKEGATSPAPMVEAPKAPKAPKTSRAKSKKQTLGVRILFTGVSVLLLLIGARAAINHLNRTMHKFSQQTIVNAARASEERRLAQPASVAHLSLPAINATQVAAPRSAPTPVQKFETWGVQAPIVPDVQSNQPRGETAAERKAREAYLRAIPEV